MSTKLDLRRSLRLTVEEGKVLLVLLGEAKGRAADSARVKLAAAMQMATHTCTGPICPVCQQDPQAKDRLRAKRAKTMAQSLQDAKQLQRKIAADMRREALENPSPPPPLKFVNAAQPEISWPPPEQYNIMGAIKEAKQKIEGNCGIKMVAPLQGAEE